MAVLNLSFDEFNMNPEAVASEIGSIVATLQQVEEYTTFMKNKIQAVNDLFQSNNYDRICEALSNCESKLGKASEELSELFKSCSDLSEKVSVIVS